MTSAMILARRAQRIMQCVKEYHNYKESFYEGGNNHIHVVRIPSGTILKKFSDSDRLDKLGPWYLLPQRMNLSSALLEEAIKREGYINFEKRMEFLGFDEAYSVVEAEDYLEKNQTETEIAIKPFRDILAIKQDWSDLKYVVEATVQEDTYAIFGPVARQEKVSEEVRRELAILILRYEKEVDLEKKYIWRDQISKIYQQQIRDLPDLRGSRFYLGGSSVNQLLIPFSESNLYAPVGPHQPKKSRKTIDYFHEAKTYDDLIVQFQKLSSDTLEKFKNNGWNMQELMEPYPESLITTTSDNFINWLRQRLKLDEFIPSIQVDSVEKNEHSIILSGESYSLLEIPAESSSAVTAGKEAILENLRLDNLVTGLERASGLVYVAQNGVAGFGSLMAAMTGLGDGIISAAADASLTLSGFSDDSEAILRSLKRSMGFLLKGREKLAVKYLAKCAKSAQEMSTESEKLADRFDELGDQTIEVLQDTQIEQGRQHLKIADERRKLAELKANNAAAQTLKQELATQQSQLKSMYQEAKKQQEKAENRAFAMQIIGAITGALGAGLNTVMGSRGGGRATSAPASAPAPAPAPVPAPTPVKESSAPAQTTEPEDGKTSEAEDSDTSAKQSTKETEAAIKGVAAASTATAQRTGPIASSQQTAGQSYRDEKMKYLDKLLEVEANQRKALADIAKYAELLKSSAEEKKIAETTAAALHQAVGALKSIAATLRDNAFFWQLMTRACEKLAEPDFLEFIQDVSDLPFEERLELYLEDDFKVEIVTYYAQWQALKLVCDEYSTAVFDARANLLADFQQYPTIEEAQKQAPILAGQLLAETQADLQALDARTAEIQAEQAAIEVNAEAVV